VDEGKGRGGDGRGAREERKGEARGAKGKGAFPGSSYFPRM